MDIRSRLDGNVAIIELAGRLTVNDRSGLLKETVVSALAQGAKNVLIDLKGVNYIDSTRLGELIASHVTVSRNGGRLTLLRTPPRVAELLHISGLGTVFEQFTSIDEAKASLG